MKINMTPSFVKTVELSTFHISLADTELLVAKSDEYRLTNSGPIVMMHVNGFVIPIGEPTVNALKDAGASPEFAAILDACLLEGDIMYLCFDGDADLLEGLPGFDW